ncbi:MAG TPA: CopD family protein [Steroidobacteraceae bacterium]|nr:CopD family protein [Steroidobacteraceae bacterium]
MIDGLWLALRAAGLVLTLQAAGAELFLAGFRVRLGHCAVPLQRHARRVAGTALLVCLAQCAAEVAHMAGEWAGLTDPALLRLLTLSSAGVALLIRLAATALLLATVGRSSALARGLAVAGSVAIPLSFIFTGHTSVSPARASLAGLLLVHVAVAAFWFGSLWPLRRIAASAPPPQAAQLVAAFSRAGVWLVPLIPLAGVGLALLLLPDVRVLGSPYGRLLCVKVALFALLMLLAALNRLRLAPDMARGVAAAFSRFRRTVLLEWLLIALTLAVTAALTGLYSPPHAGRAVAEISARA